MYCRIVTDDGVFHGQMVYTDDGEFIGEELIIEDGEPIPIDKCLCFAYEPGECCCATTSWVNYKYWDE